ncbi:KAP family NTPase, partial [Faecalibacillus intestinalis]|nr:KAP family NTPase [Faecalibacillus intestinalis]
MTNEIAQTKWVMTNELFKLAFEVCRVGLKLATNIDIKKISESFNDWKNFEDWKNFQKSKKDRQDGFTEALNKLITKSGKKIIFFIDELDRCKHTYAIKL